MRWRQCAGKKTGDDDDDDATSDPDDSAPLLNLAMKAMKAMKVAGAGGSKTSRALSAASRIQEFIDESQNQEAKRTDVLNAGKAGGLRVMKRPAGNTAPSARMDRNKKYAWSRAVAKGTIGQDVYTCS